MRADTIQLAIAGTLRLQHEGPSSFGTPSATGWDASIGEMDTVPPFSSKQIPYHLTATFDDTIQPNPKYYTASHGSWELGPNSTELIAFGDYSLKITN